jgi:hypothetical protein
MLFHNQDTNFETAGYRATAPKSSPRVGLRDGRIVRPPVTPTPVPSKLALRAAASPDPLSHPWLLGRVGSGSRAAARRAGKRPRPNDELRYSHLFYRGDDE